MRSAKDAESVPDHSVLSKARARRGKEVFESLFVRTVAQCVDAGLVDGKKLHVDASLIEADAAKESVIKAAPPLIAAPETGITLPASS
jgi:transposase